MRIDTYTIKPHVVFVNGITRSLVTNLMSKEIWLIPEAMSLMFSNNRSGSQASLELEFETEYVYQYLDFLREKKLIFPTIVDTVESKINTEYFRSSEITNCILVIDKYTIAFLGNIVIQLSKMQTTHVQLQISMCCDLRLLKDILASFDRSTIEGIEIHFKYYEGLEIQWLIDLMDKYKRVSFIVLLNYIGNLLSVDKRLIGVKEANVSTLTLSCGMISSDYFVSNIEFYSESQFFNTCLNRKVSICADGEIKNCPSMPTSFGNISNTNIIDAINKPGFKKYWNINKDKIHVCKDCEFRYICTDCRAYVEDPEDILSKPLKCGYNPYTGEWDEWSTNPLKQKAIDFYGMREMVEQQNANK